jgi:hypothetical protein
MIEDSTATLERIHKMLLATSKSTIKPPYSPVSQVSSTLLPVTEVTKIMAFRENYQ